jgi:hypothetical protein
MQCGSLVAVVAIAAFFAADAAEAGYLTYQSVCGSPCNPDLAYSFPSAWLPPSTVPIVILNIPFVPPCNGDGTPAPGFAACGPVWYNGSYPP